jgi:hypothetical protein
MPWDGSHVKRKVAQSRDHKFVSDALTYGTCKSDSAIRSAGIAGLRLIYAKASVGIEVDGNR